MGARTNAQLSDNLGAATLELTASDLTRLEEVSRPTLIYPYWHQNWFANDRFSAGDLALHEPFLKK